MYMVESASSTLNNQFIVLNGGDKMDPVFYLNNMGYMHAISASLKRIAGSYSTAILKHVEVVAAMHIIPVTL